MKDIMNDKLSSVIVQRTQSRRILDKAWKRSILHRMGNLDDLPT